jgi:hypothetical protein
MRQKASAPGATESAPGESVFAPSGNVSALAEYAIPPDRRNLRMVGHPRPLVVWPMPIATRLRLFETRLHPLQPVHAHCYSSASIRIPSARRARSPRPEDAVNAYLGPV